MFINATTKLLHERKAREKSIDKLFEFVDNVHVLQCGYLILSIVLTETRICSLFISNKKSKKQILKPQYLQNKT